MNHSTPDLLTPRQELLLKAAICNEKDFPERWKNCLVVIDPKNLSSSERKLLPFLKQNLPKGLSDPLADICFQSYVETTLWNELLFRHLKIICDAFHDAELELLVLKGAALIPAYYKDKGLRRMSDIDLMVPFEEMDEAIVTLKNLSYEIRQHERAYLFNKGINFSHSKGVHVDLHHSLFQFNIDEDVTSEYWEKAVPIPSEILNTVFPGRMLCPTDQFFHLCSHGTKTGKLESHVRWVADAWMFFKEERNAIDWDRLVSLAERQGVANETEWALAYLESHWMFEIPEEVLLQLRESENRPEQIELRKTLIEVGSKDYFGLLRRHGIIFRNGIRGKSWTERIRLLRVYCLGWCRVRRMTEVPLVLSKKLQNKLFSR